MLLGTMCKGLGVRPRQAAGLLDGNVRHLATVLTAGIQGQFGAVRAWLELVHARSRDVYALIQASEGSRQQAHETAVGVYVLLRPALLSASAEVAVWGMRVFAEMAGDLLKTFIHAASHEFLLDGGRGLEALVLCHKRHCARPSPHQARVGARTLFHTWDATPFVLTITITAVHGSMVDGVTPLRTIAAPFFVRR